MQRTFPIDCFRSIYLQNAPRCNAIVTFVVLPCDNPEIIRAIFYNVGEWTGDDAVHIAMRIAMIYLIDNH